jgi:hypothetical protein
MDSIGAGERGTITRFVYFQSCERGSIYCSIVEDHGEVSSGSAPVAASSVLALHGSMAAGARLRRVGGHKIPREKQGAEECNKGERGDSRTCYPG